MCARGKDFVCYLTRSPSIYLSEHTHIHCVCVCVCDPLYVGVSDSTEVRCAESAKIRGKYQDRIPVSAHYKEQYLDTIIRSVIFHFQLLWSLPEFSPSPHHTHTHTHTCTHTHTHTHTPQVIVEKVPKSTIPDIDKKKFLVPADLSGRLYIHVHTCIYELWGNESCGGPLM